MKKRIKPKAGQESVWDYPRPPRLEQTNRHLKVVVNNQVIAETTNAYRILETSHPPTYYFPPEDVRTEFFQKRPKDSSMCEFKGRAAYWDILVENETKPAAAWSYPQPRAPYEAIKDHFCFYASRVDACYVDGEKVQAQEGDFYGGWITSDVVGPFKGGAGTWGW